MLRFVLQRILLIILVLLTIIFAVHWGMLMAQRADGPETRPTAWEVAGDAFAESRSFVTNALHGDLGTYQTEFGPMDVKELLRQSFSASMGILLLAGAVSALVGVLLGIFVALTRFRAIPITVLAATVVGISVPSFFAAMLLQQFIIFYLREYDRRLLNVAGFGWDYGHLVLPILVLSARPIAYLMRTAYIMLDRTMQEDYIRTAYSKGLSRRHTVNVHALRNVAVPVLTAIGVSWRFSLGILPIVEYMFAWPGMGLRMLEGIQSSQISEVVPLAAVFGLVFLLGNLILDILYRLIDPRIREDA
jgi:ABC-type dipeptide/oligopeptide/nickel transport system permease component